ncbi:proton-conducting transporter membrane subunit, partial [Mycolicibacterium sp.]|uniref:proton-conducting transporter transmembrane domain-containing protein n=1 Tax=Mycolicibacterium sp. TaxID=2320850 RepID=UPI00355D49CE
MTALLAVDVPAVEYAQLSPMLIVVGVAVAGVLVEAFFPRSLRYGTQLVLSLGGLGAALVAVVLLLRDLGGGPGNSAMMGSVAIDAPALFLQATVLVIAVLGILLIAERHLPAENGGETGGLDGFTPQAAAVPGSVAEKEATRAGVMQTEVFPMTMFAVTGMLLFGAADDLLTMFIALEVLSLPLYLLCGLARHRRLLSQEAALKYFLLGAFSSAFFLYGVALLYGYSGTFELTGIAEAVAEPVGRSSTMALIGLVLVAVGLLFK